METQLHGAEKWQSWDSWIFIWASVFSVVAEYRNIRTSRKSLGLNAEDILIKDKVSCFWVLEFFKMQSQMMIWVKDTLFQHMTNHPIDVLFKQAFQGGKFYMGRYK